MGIDSSGFIIVSVPSKMSAKNNKNPSNSKRDSAQLVDFSNPCPNDTVIKELKPLFKVGTKVYAAWWSDKTRRNGIPAWYPGVVKSLKEVKIKDVRYGPLRLYDIEYDDGDFLDGVEDCFVFSHRDYLLSMKKEGNNDETSVDSSWIGVRNVRDEESSDDWASKVGWYNAMINGNEESFSHLSDALRSFDAAVVQAKGIQTKSSDLNLPDEWKFFVSSNFKSLQYKSGKYAARIKYKGKGVYLGTFNLASDGAFAADEAVRIFMLQDPTKERHINFLTKQDYYDSRASEIEATSQNIDLEQTLAEIESKVTGAVQRASKPNCRSSDVATKSKAVLMKSVEKIDDVLTDVVTEVAPFAGEAEKGLRVLSHVLFGTGKIVCREHPIYSERLEDATSQESHAAVPAPVPFDPINEEWERSTPLERELAWLTEESRLLLQSHRRKEYDPNLKLPLVLGFAQHGSLQLQDVLKAKFVEEKLLLPTSKDLLSKDGMVVVDVNNLPLHGKEVPSTSCFSDAFRRLCQEARQALLLGYRRSDSIELELDGTLGTRSCNVTGAQSKLRRKRTCKTQRLKNGDIVVDEKLSSKPDPLLKPASKALNDAKAMKDMHRIALSVPDELNKLEEELAWLVEESSLSLPANNQVENIVSSGPTQAMDINWAYCNHHASEPLRQLLEKVGTRRPLQRIVRSYSTDVKVSFSRRRDAIFSILLGGYRRAKTQEFLPSHEYLLQSGLAHILTVRHRRYKQFSGGSIQESASRKELRSACNSRTDNISMKDITNSPRKRKFKQMVKESTASSHCKIRMI